MLCTLLGATGMAMATTNPIEILRHEKESTATRLSKETNPEARVRLQKDMEALDREIAIWEKKGNIIIAGAPPTTAYTPKENTGVSTGNSSTNTANVSMGSTTSAARGASGASKLGVWEANTQ